MATKNSLSIQLVDVHINANKAIKHPTIVIGTPVNEPSKVETLYLANLKAPQIGNKINKIIPMIPCGPNVPNSKKIYSNMDGATPKDTKSAKESNSLPNSLET